MADKITFDDKVSLTTSALPRANKCTDNDLNEIKQVVNDNADELDENTANIVEVQQQVTQLNEKIYVELQQASNIDNLKTNGKFGIYNATGTLPSGYSTSDNNIIVECIMWTEEYGRQILYDVRTVKTWIRRIDSSGWKPWHEFSLIS